MQKNGKISPAAGLLGVTVPGNRKSCAVRSSLPGCDHFFNSRQKFCEVFFTKPLHNGFFDAFCHCPDHCRNRRDTPLKTQKIAFSQL